jgi:hypothetical protein
MGQTLAGVGFVLALVALGRGVVLGRPRPLATAGLLAIVALYILAGSVRAQLDFDYAVVSRYVYVAGFLLALALADTLGPLREHLGSGSRRTVVWSTALAIGCAAVTVFGIGPLRGSRDAMLDQADRTRAYIALAQEYQGEPWVDPRSGSWTMPSVSLLARIVDAHGSPTHDRFFPGVARMPSPAAREDALLLLVGDRFRVEAASPPPSAPLAAEVDEVGDATVVRREDCFVITPAGRLPSATFRLRDSSRLRLSSRRSGRVVAALGLDRRPAMPVTTELSAHRPMDIVVPDIRPVMSVRIRVELGGSSSPVTVCPLAHDRG